MNIFGNFYDKAYGFKSSKKERRMRHSEDWSAAILSGSSEKIQLEDPVKTPVYIIFIVGLVFLALVLLSRLAYLQIITGQRNSLLASGNRIRVNPIAAPRGAIYDRNGIVLARNNARFDVVAISGNGKTNYWSFRQAWSTQKDFRRRQPHSADRDD